MKEAISDAAEFTTTKLHEVRRNANVPVKMNENICGGIQKLHQNMGKDKSRNGYMHICNGIF